MIRLQRGISSRDYQPILFEHGPMRQRVVAMLAETESSMTTLFSPFKLRGLTLPNRIMVAPMCQYSAEHGAATSWHFIHMGTLALSGAGMFCIEATHVEPGGRISPSCLGLWDDTTEAALQLIIAAIRKNSKIAVAMQLAHAGRKASSQVPWKGGQQIPLSAGGWIACAPSA